MQVSNVENHISAVSHFFVTFSLSILSRETKELKFYRTEAYNDSKERRKTHLNLSLSLNSPLTSNKCLSSYA